MKRSLGATQRWMQEAITRGKGSDAEEVIRSPNIGARRGLGIYIRAYRSRLTDCMRKEYPVLSKAIGEKPFEAFVDGYLASFPPNSYTLANLGERFPKYLDDTKPGSNPSWEDFIIELASLERCFFEVFDAPGSEGKTFPVDGYGPRMRVVPVPCLRLLAFRYPVDRYFVDLKRGGNPRLPRAKKTFVAVSRRDYIVRFYSLTNEEFEVLGALMCGKSIGEAGKKAGAGKISKYMQGWIGNGFFLQIA